LQALAAAGIRARLPAVPKDNLRERALAPAGTLVPRFLQEISTHAFFDQMSKPARNSHPISALAIARTFFITSKTFRGQALLQSERMAMLVIDVLCTHVSARRVGIHDFVVMPGHLHVSLLKKQMRTGG
jgi:hypothetical protein